MGLFCVHGRSHRWSKIASQMIALMMIAAPVPGMAQAQKRQGAAVRLDTLYQLCSLKQREILAHNKAILEAGVIYMSTADAAKRAQTIRTIETYRQSAAQAELSWQRLGCYDLMYNKNSERTR